MSVEIIRAGIEQIKASCAVCLGDFLTAEANTGGMTEYKDTIVISANEGKTDTQILLRHDDAVAFAQGLLDLVAQERKKLGK